MSDFIPEDVVVDILSRLPTKSLIRFRSVSKLWNSLIKSPNFINTQLNRSLISKNSYDNLPLVIVRQCIASSPPFTRLEHYKLFIDSGEEDNKFDEYLEIPFPLKSRRLHYYYLMGYVKGLFCVFEQDNYFLWNPSIRKSISLPKPGITKKTHGTLVDYPGFGFDSRSNDYKIVRVILLCGIDRPEKVILVQVYSLNAGLWKMNHEAVDSYPNGYGIGYSRNFTTYLEGSLHWVAEARGDPIDKVVLLFHLSDEVFKTIPLPNDIATPRFDIRTSEFGGFLSLLCEDNIDRANKSCSIWIMKEYGVVDSWYKYVKINLTGGGGISEVIGIRKNGHILFEGTTPRPWELFSYDPRNKEIKELGINGTIGHFHVDTYEENLILLNKTDVPVSTRGGSRKRKDRFPLDQSTQSQIEAQTLATDVQRLKHELVVLQERVKGKIEVACEVIAKMGPQHLAELGTKLQIYSLQFAPKDVRGNDGMKVVVIKLNLNLKKLHITILVEEISSVRLTSTSQDSVANDCDVAEKFSHNRILGRGESVKGKHVNGETSARQGFCNKDCLRNENLEIWREMKADYAGMLEKVSQMDQYLQTIIT